jgi:release factor glutamine methyltransferase
MTTIAEILRGARDEAQRRDFEVLIAHALDVGRAHLYAHGSDPLSSAQLHCLQGPLDACRAGMPVAYVTGRREFWDLELDVSPAVLIPRPETELLVELALERLPPRARVLDLGTGSAAIALALKHERGDCVVVATDVSEPALAVARRNAAKHAIDVELRLGSWYSVAAERFDVIVSNPPYIRSDDPHLDLLVSEPRMALAAGSDGLDALRAVIGGAPEHLVPGGWLLVEHGYDQGTAVRALFACAGFTVIETVRDGSGHERVTLAKR